MLTSDGGSWMIVVVENDALENGLKQPLLISSSEDKQQDEDGEQECDESEEASEDSHRPATSIRSAYRLLTPSVKVCDWLRILYEFCKIDNYIFDVIIDIKN